MIELWFLVMPGMELFAAMGFISFCVGSLMSSLILGDDFLVEVLESEDPRLRGTSSEDDTGSYWTYCDCAYGSHF